MIKIITISKFFSKPELRTWLQYVIYTFLEVTVIKYILMVNYEGKYF